MVRIGILAVVLAGTKAAAPSPSPTPTPVPTPSLQDSISFLREKLETYGSYSFKIAVSDDPSEKGKVQASNTIASFDDSGCVLTVTRKLVWNTAIEGEPDADYAETSTIDLRIPLKEVEPKVKLGPMPDVFRKAFTASAHESFVHLSIAATGTKKPIGVREARSVRSEGKSRSENVDDNIGTTYLVLTDTDIARRAADAIEHAMKLCQRKREKF